ncbi:MAG TPA: hypothetical protein VFY73_28990 [Ideonella sp.]|uniref:hypothetical protein n=1 Tax=Ideonella sp. TaxID=1929293 RepID=UPI002E3580D1|nr:hypothetical protein [Ideonella sp.]HEX5688074.1 hypothetical protein [Ideonella sp.]
MIDFRSTRLLRSFAGAALAAAVQLAWAHPTYTIDATPLDSLLQSPAGLNKRGWVAENVDSDDADGGGYRCTRSACVRIPALPNTSGATGVKASAIDELGVVVGESPAGSVAHAFRFDGTTVEDLGALAAGGYSAAYASNKLGQVVGSSRDAGGNDMPFVWQAGVMTPLPTLGGDWGTALAINEAGVIAGSAMTADGEYHAVTYRDGRIKDLGVLPGGYIAAARSINRHGQVVGESSTDGMFKTRAFIYEKGQMREMPALPDTRDGRAYSINDSGWAVGSALVHGKGVRGFAFDGASTFDLNDALSPADRKHWMIEAAYAINAKGQILVSARDRTQFGYRVLVLSPQ